MDNSDIKDPLFREAVEAIDAGDISLLMRLLNENPQLINKRLDTPIDGYFANPYLMWFVAENPIRHEKLPANIIDVTRVLIEAAKKNAPESFREQINYTLGLVATGRIPRESGVQNEWIDLLIDNGAMPENGIGALAHGNVGAAKHLIERGGTLTLATAVGLNLEDAVHHLLKDTTRSDIEIALMMAAFYGRSKMISLLLNHGVNVNVYLGRSGGFHSHATALHQAVFSGSLESVKLLVDAGANLNAIDKIYEGTPLEWAQYMQKEETDASKKEQYKEIETFLQHKM